MLELINRLLLKNRTIVSRDMVESVETIRRAYPVEVHRYPSGAEFQTWVVPPEWNVRHATLSAGGTLIAGYEESPLFVAPYSMPFRGTVDREELLRHTLTNPNRPTAFCYEHRIGADHRRRLKEWRITLPYTRVQSLPAGPFEVSIDVEVRPGHLEIAELSHPGSSGHWFTFLSHLCHPAQANDGLAGVAIMLETMTRVARKYPAPRHGYKALILPETFGSSIYAASHANALDSMLGAVFSEMGGAEAPLQLKLSRRGDTYIDRVFQHVLRQAGKLGRTVTFRNGWGNDELVFDAPGVGVPSVSLDRYPFDAYHTHHDDLSLVALSSLEEIVSLLTAVVDVLEHDYIPRPKQRVPVYLTRFDLYSDWTHARDQYDLNVTLVESVWSGMSIFDIALANGLEVAQVHAYLDRFVALDLISAEPVSPEYTRTMRVPPAERRSS